MPQYDQHMVRSNHNREQVFDYPNYINLPMLKIIEDELQHELEIKDDLEMKNLNSKNKVGEVL